MKNETETNPVVYVVDVIFNTLARALVSFFDGIKHAVDHANPSLFALIAVLLPYALPLPVALMTAASARVFFGWGPRESFILGFGLEGLGLLIWVKLADSIVIGVTSAHEKIENYTRFLWGAAIAYEGLLIALNVILAVQEGAGLIYALTLLLVCLLPALSAIMYGLHKRETLAQLAAEQTKAEALAERIRQEQRQDRKEARELKLRLAADTKAEGLKEKSFRK